ncbi:MAG: Uma2 family endonuclease [Pyrinomonadaceae bacterium]
MTTAVNTTLRWTSADLAAFPDNGKRYEIVDGELYVSKQPHWHHQKACMNILLLLQTWSRQSGLGTAAMAPGLIFAEDNDVAPDVVWISRRQLQTALEEDGKLHSAPELVVEVVSRGFENERRDREVKLKLYSRRGVSEYWIADWWNEKIEVFQRQNSELQLVATLFSNDVLSSPLLPNFHCEVRELFAGI